MEMCSFSFVFYRLKWYGDSFVPIPDVIFIEDFRYTTGETVVSRVIVLPEVTEPLLTIKNAEATPSEMGTNVHWCRSILNNQLLLTQ